MAKHLPTLIIWVLTILLVLASFYGEEKGWFPKWVPFFISILSGTIVTFFLIIHDVYNSRRKLRKNEQLLGALDQIASTLHNNINHPHLSPEQKVYYKEMFRKIVDIKTQVAISDIDDKFLPVKTLRDALNS